MKKHLIRLLCLFILCQLMNPSILFASAIDINGMNISGKEKKDYFIDNDRLMISQNIVKDNFFLNLDITGNHYTLSNDEKNIIFEGTVNKSDYIFNGKKKQFPVKVIKQNDMLFFPIRGLVENFGNVRWDVNANQANIRFDFNRFEDIEPFKVAEKTILYELKPITEQINSSHSSPSNEKRAVSLLSDGTVIYEKMVGGWLTSVETDQNILIAPQHENYTIGKYSIQEDVTTWIEYPIELSEIDQAWYLYTMNNTPNNNPRCIDQGSFKKLKEISGGEYILGNICFKKDKVFYLFYNDQNNALEVRLSDLKDGPTLTLDELSVSDYPNGTMEVALNNNEAIWTKALFLERYKEYGSLFKYDLNTKKTTQLFKGCNFLSPELTDQYLIVKNKPQGENFIISQNKKRIISTEIWIYDLTNKKWQGKVDNTIPMISTNEIVAMPVLLDDEHMTVNVEGRGTAYDMPIVNFQKGTIMKAKDKEGNILQYSPYEVLDKTPFKITTTNLKDTFILNSYVEKTDTKETGRTDSMLQFYW